MNDDSTVRVPGPIVQIIITLVLSAASAFGGVVAGNAVTKSQILDLDRRLTAMETKMDKITDQQIQVYQSQLTIMKHQLEQDNVNDNK